MHLSTLTLAQALQTRLAALTFPDGGEAWAGEPIFEAVRLYDVPRLEEALSDLLTFENRICLIAPGDESYESTLRGAALEVTKTADWMLLFADTNYIPGKAAYFGDEARPGLLRICEAVIADLTGSDLGLSPAPLLVPEEGQSLRVAGGEGQLGETREGYQLVMRAQMGQTREQIKRGRLL